MLAQVQITAKPNEIPAFTPLLLLAKTVRGSLDGILNVADALHAQIGHADLAAEHGAHLMVTTKANQPKLFAELKALPWAKVPVGAQTRETGHGRKETRTVKALAVATPGGIGFSRAAQAVRITRTRTVQGKTSRETAYLASSPPVGQARPVDRGAWARAEWQIENRARSTGPYPTATACTLVSGYRSMSGSPGSATAWPVSAPRAARCPPADDPHRPIALPSRP
ncbi:hypothetical protein Acsp01_81410 [Actinoplanes sp. NBRC 101535]|nr:hypothetical protein [Actinoplanes sp. NBRC 101535]GLY07762.1 hypothetical protein Acsp01_81410 [Actinoplanes sp. NBRC 101535]